MEKTHVKTSVWSCGIGRGDLLVGLPTAATRPYVYMNKKQKFKK